MGPPRQWRSAGSVVLWRNSRVERWLTRITIDHAERILPVDGPVADQWGRLTAKQPGSVIDTLMAATALVHGFVLVASNVNKASPARPRFEPST